MPFEREVRDLAHVPRWSIIRQIKQQSVAEHSYFVAVYSMQLADIIGWNGDRAELLTWALKHDWVESWIGDLNGAAKKHFVDPERYAAYERKGLTDRFGEVAEPSEAVRAIVKAADMIDEMLYLCGEMQMGNSSVRCLKEQSVRKRLDDAIRNLPCGDQQKTAVMALVGHAAARETTDCSEVVL